nr:DUF903 domain-containing protein [Aeromonas popoffii]
MSTGDGKMITPDSKPKRDEGTGIYRYDDTEGVGGDDQEG